MATASTIGDAVLSNHCGAATISIPGVDALTNSDGLLVHRIRGGEKDLFYELVRPHLRMVRRIVSKNVRDEARVEDVVQQAVVRAFVQFHQLRCAQFFRAWLIRIAINEARMIQREERNVLSVGIRGEGAVEGADSILPDAIPDPRATPLEVFEHKETHHIFRSAIQRLPVKLRQVVILRHLEEDSIQETARMLGISIAATKARLHRARRELKMRRSIQNLMAFMPVRGRSPSI